MEGMTFLPTGWNISSVSPPLISIIPPGANVRIGGSSEDEFAGVVCQACIREGGAVQYQVAWWNGRERRCEWLEACEVVTAQEAARQEIGFSR